jgi:hypothetical protein
MGAYEGPTNFLNVGAAPSLMLNFAREKSLEDQISGKDLITFTRSSAGTYVGADGLIKTAAADEPRFDHDPATGESLGLLIEEVRINYFDYSESSTWEDYNANRTILEESALGILSPTGSTPLVIRPTDTGFTNNLVNDRYEPYPSSGGDMIFSVFVKKIDGSQYEEIRLHASAVFANTFTASLIFNLTTLTTRGSIGTASNAGIFDYGNGWYRICMKFTCPASTEGPIQRMEIIDDIVPQGTAQSNGILVFGMQLELGSFPTSYIPTSGSAVTRQPDNAQITGTNFTDFYNATEGTIFAAFNNMQNSNDTLWAIGEVSATIRRIVYQKNSIIIRTDSGVGATYLNHILSDNNKSSVAYVATEKKVYESLNGSSAVSSATHSESWITASGFQIGNQQFITTQPANTRIKQLIYYPARISDIKLQQMTKVFS